MRHASLRLHFLATVTVLVLLLSFAAAAPEEPTMPTVEHKCGFDHVMQYHNATPTGVTLTHEDPDTGALVYEGLSRSSSGTYAPIRIGVFFNDLDDPSKYCTSASGTAPDFQGGTASCTADNVLTAEKKNILKTKLIPEAVQLHVDRLKVDPLNSPIVVPSNLGTVCKSFSIPASHKTTGVSGYDYVLYVAAGPAEPGIAAWAVSCAFLTGPNGGIGRPNIGVTNIPPSSIAATHRAERTVAHEILHGLGFSQFYFDPAGIVTTATVRQKTNVPVMNSAKVVSAVKTHYGCDSLTHMELEDAGGSGSAGSHWKRRNAKDELMSPVVSHSFYTAMTIAAMEDLGYYQGDYTKAEMMPWGLNAGCKLLTDMCMTNSVSLDQSMFCTGGTMICSSDRDAVGTCYTTSASLPSWAASYGLFNNDMSMDYCPYVIDYLETVCANGQLKYAPDSKFGDSSRCLDVSSGKAVCAAITCSAATYTVQFQTGSAIACTPGSTVTIPGTSRTVTCPPYIEVCDMQCAGSCQGANASTMMTAGGTGVLLALLGVLLSMLA